MLLKAERIYFRYSNGTKGTNPWLIQDVSLSVQAGEIVGLVGASGSGKTSLCQILAGYIQPMSGRVTLDGQPLPKARYHPVQLVYQHPEKAVNPRWRMRSTLNEAWTPDKQTLAALGIEPAWLDRYPNELSGGELQRFCIARALGPDTRFIIADEMTTMLDAITQAQIWQAVLTLAQQRNIGLLVVSHEQSLIQRLCHRVISLES